MRADSQYGAKAWISTTLGGVASITLGGTPSTLVPRYWNGQIPWMASGDVHKRHIFDVDGRITDLGLASSNAALTYPPAVAMALAGQGKTRGTVALVHIELCTNQSVALIKGEPKTLDTAFLFHNLDFRYEEMRARSSGGGRGGLSCATIRSTPIELPPITEQVKISEILDSLDVGIERTEQFVEKLKFARQGLLHDLLARGIDHNGELRDPIRHPEQFKDSPLGRIPQSWTVVSLGQIAAVRSGATPSRKLRTRYFDPAGTPWVKTLDLNEDIITETEESIADVALRETSCSVLPPGTVLVAMYGGWEQIGRTAILGRESATNQAISGLLLGSGITPEFALRALQAGRSRWRGLAASTRKDPNVKKQDVLSFMIPMPGDPDEQLRIIDCYRTVLDRLAGEVVACGKLRLLKQALMDDLLTGLVRVTPLLEKAPSP